MGRCVGVDCGTGNIASAEQSVEENKIAFRKVRDCFFKVDPSQFLGGANPMFGEKMLKKTGAHFIKVDDTLYILGDSAYNMATTVHKETLRPMAKGVLNPDEPESAVMIAELIKATAGKGTPEDTLFFCVPAKPVDADFDIEYHRETLKEIFSKLGYEKIHVMEEGLAVVFSELMEENFTGAAISFGSGMANMCYAFMGMPILSFSISRCLDEDTEILTNYGLVKIKDIEKETHKVIDVNGKLCDINEKYYNGEVEEINELILEGWNHAKYITPNHKIFVKEGINWTEKELRNVKEGDIVGEAVVNFDQNNKFKDLYTGMDKNGEYKSFQYNRNLGRIIGIFLGDGCAVYNENTSQYNISISFNNKYPELIEKYEQILKMVFKGYNIRIEPLETYTNIFVTEKNISKKFKETFYHNKTKLLGIPLDEIPNNMALGIIEGLYDSDGWMYHNRYNFQNTSSNLVFSLRQLLGRFGINGTIKTSEPHEGTHKNKYGKLIHSRLKSYIYTIGTKYHNEMLKSLIRDYEFNHVKVVKQDFLTTIVKSNKTIQRKSKVYDLNIKSENSSYTLPLITVHNCGDYIDQGAAKSMNETANTMCNIKERGMSIKSPKDDNEKAIAIYYKTLLKYLVSQIKFLYNEKDKKDLPNLFKPIPLVVAGGTSLVGDFIQVLKETIAEEKDFPIPISEIRHAQQPLFSVVHGLHQAATLQAE